MYDSKYLLLMSNGIIVITKGRQHHEVIGCQVGIRKMKMKKIIKHCWLLNNKILYGTIR